MTPLLEQVIAKLANATIRERYIAPGKHDRAVYGQIEGNVITINPVPAIVETLVHEGVHAVDFSYSEATVNRLTSRLLREMTEPEVRALYAIYREKRR